MPAPADSFAAPGRPPTWLNPVAWGVTLVGVRGALPPDVDAMPLYLLEGQDAYVSSPLHVGSRVSKGGHVVEVGTSEGRGHNAQVLHEHIQQLATAVALVYALEHGRHLARLDRLEDLDDGLQVCVLGIITRQQHKSLSSYPNRGRPHTACVPFRP